MKIRAIVRDVLLVFGFTMLGGFVIGIAVGKSGLASSQGQTAIAISNLLFSIVAFCISGILVRRQRFRHLFAVAFFCWLAGAFNVLIFPQVSILHWVFSSIFTLIAMSIGGGMSFLFSPEPKEKSQVATQPTVQADGPASGGPAA